VNDLKTEDKFYKLHLNKFNFQPNLKSSSNYIAFGTTNGLLILYDINTFKRKAVLGTLNEDLVVLSIDFFKDDDVDYLVSSYSSGLITIWDLKSFMPLKQLNGVFNSPVLHCKFLNRYNLVASDSNVKKN
jgi:WD40 repeat protein